MIIKTVKSEYQNEVINLQDVKDYLRVSDNTDDLLITGLSRAAVDYCNAYLGFEINACEKRLKVTAVDPDGSVLLPSDPRRQTEVTAVTDASGAALDWEYEDGVLTVENQPELMYVDVTETPILANRGFLISACYLLIGKLYEQRGDESKSLSEGGWPTVDRLLDLAAVVQI